MGRGGQSVAWEEEAMAHISRGWRPQEAQMMATKKRKMNQSNKRAAVKDLTARSARSVKGGGDTTVERKPGKIIFD